MQSDLVVVDLALGTTDAAEVIRQLRVITFIGRILLISGRDEGMLSEIEQIGQSHALLMSRSLRKPFRIADAAQCLLWVKSADSGPKRK